MRKSVLLLVFALALLSAGCLRIDWSSVLENFDHGPDVTVTTMPGTSIPHPTTTAPPEEPGRMRGPVYVDSVEILLLESYPVQVRALVKGNLPTPCHSLGWEVSGPDAAGRITLELYSTAEDGGVCAQVLEPFEEPIDVGSFTSGSHVLVVGGVEYSFTI